MPAGAGQKAIRLFLVDDHEMVREGLRKMLGHYGDIVVVGEAATATDALRSIPRMHPDVVLLDLRLPDRTGLEVLSELQTLPECPAVLVLTVHDDDDLVLSAARSGARGYVLKHTSHEELSSAIRRVAEGGHYFSPDVVGALVEVERRADDQVVLSDREKEVLKGLVDGLSNREIGERLFLSGDTVKSHLGSIYRKLGVESRTQAVVAAFRGKLLE